MRYGMRVEITFARGAGFALLLAVAACQSASAATLDDPIVPERTVDATTKQAAPESLRSCPLPSSFTLWQDAGRVYGNQSALSSNAASGDSTQWAVAVINTSRYAAKATHAAIALLFRPNLHGLGAIFGNNSGSTEGCSGIPFTTQLEAFSYWLPTASSEESLFQAKVFESSCGLRMADGVDYAIIVQANRSQDVAYQVNVRNGIGWAPGTPWISANPTTPKWQWHVAPAYFDTTVSGIDVRAFPTWPPTEDPAFDWTINVKEFDCGWF